MATFIRLVLSGSINGRPIDVSSTAGTTATLIHKGSSGTAVFDEVFVYAFNRSTANASLRLEWGASGSADIIIADVPPQEEPVLISPGLPIQGVATNLEIIAAGTVSGVISLIGYVNRIDQS